MVQLSKTTRGQVIIGVAVALFAMFGLLGLTFDLGWSFYLEKSAQLAADSAAMSAGLEVLEIGGAVGPYDCTDPSVFCSASPVACAASPAVGVDPIDSLTTGCVYARRNGFWIGNPDHRQNVRLAAASGGSVGSTVNPPAAPGVLAYYWVTAMVAEETPQIFSAVFNNDRGVVSASATAAIVDSIVSGSLFLLNREQDGNFGGKGPGVGLDVQSNATGLGYSLNAGGRIIVSSQADGTGGLGHAVEIENGNAFVQAADVAIRGTGDYSLPGNSTWDQHFSTEPRTGLPPDSKLFLDPTAGKPNPPLPQNGQQGQAFVNGTVTITDGTDNGVNEWGTGSADDPYKLLPGVYYSYQPAQKNKAATANGNPIVLPGGKNTYYRFCVDLACGPGFGEYTFIGGLEIDGTNVEYGPGRYVYVGSSINQPANKRFALDITSNASVTDGLTPGSRPPDGNAGQLHILAGPDYVGADGRTMANFVNSTNGVIVPDLTNTVSGISPIVDYAPTTLQAGTTGNAQINLHGLQPKTGTGDFLPSELEGYRRFLFWQDRENSTFRYNFDGTYPCEPNATGGACDFPNDDARIADDTRFEVNGSANFSLYGVVYQPRGSYFNSTGGGDYTSPIQIITGAFQLAGNATLDLQNLDFPLTRRVVALVQ